MTPILFIRFRSISRVRGGRVMAGEWSLSESGSKLVGSTPSRRRRAMSAIDNKMAALRYKDAPADVQDLLWAGVMGDAKPQQAEFDVI